MNSRPIHKIKRYMTDPDEFNADLKRKYNNLTLQDTKLHHNPFEALKQITVPSVLCPRLATNKQPNHLISMHQKVHVHRTALKKLYDLSYQHRSGNNVEIPQVSKGPLIFKRSNPLFVVNSLIDILKEDNEEQKAASCAKKEKKEKKLMQYNQFAEFKDTNQKLQRAPRLVEAQMNLLAHQNHNYNFSRRKIYSEQKSRQKIKNGQVELLTFYKPKQVGNLHSNQFLA